LHQTRRSAVHPPGRRVPSPYLGRETAIATIAHPESARVTVGVDTHDDLHVASARDQLGRRVAITLVPTSPAGYQHLLDWARQLGEVAAFGIEGTGSYGAALARFLRANGQQVFEVNRPDRATRRRKGKSDPLDADAAARAVQAGDAAGLPKAGTGTVEMLRVLRVARQSALKARTQATNALRALLVTAPAELREQLRGLSKTALPRTAAALDPGQLTSPTAATMLALRTLGQRHAALTAELTALEAEINRLVARHATPLLALFGVGPDSASALLVAAGDNPERLCSEAAFAALCGVSPVEASSGKTIRHRLNRGGDRQANAALYRIVLVRLRWHQPTKDYMARRVAEGKTTKEVIRCLKRYLAREVFAVLTQTGQTNHSDAA
jgi:transposase